MSSVNYSLSTKHLSLRSGLIWATPKGVFSSVEPISLLNYSYTLDCFPVASPILLSFNRQHILLESVLINLGIQFSITDNKLSRNWRKKKNKKNTSPNCDGLSTTLNSWDVVLKLVYSARLIVFSPQRTIQCWFNLTEKYVASSIQVLFSDLQTSSIFAVIFAGRLILGRVTPVLNFLYL